MRRNTFCQILLLTATVICGLSSRSFASSLPALIGDYGGDTCYALMVFFLAGLFFRSLPSVQIAVIAFLFCVAVEISQFYHAPWIDAIRHTRIGGLALGFGFLWSDIICYAVGVAIGTGIDFLIHKKRF